MLNINALRIGPRLVVGFGTVLTLFLLVLSIVGYVFVRLAADVSQIKEETLPYILIVDSMDTARSEVQQFLTDVSATHNEDGYKEAEKAAEVFLHGTAKYREMFSREGSNENVAKINAIEAAFKTFFATGKDMAKIYVTQGIAAGNAKMEEFDKSSQAISTKLAEFRKEQIAEAEAMTSHAQNSAELALGVLVSGAALAFIVAGLITWLISRSIIKPLLAMQDVIVNLGRNSDLTLRVPMSTEDELGTMAAHVNETLGRIQDTMRTVNQVAAEVASSATQLSAATATLTESCETQASTASEMAATVEEVTTSVGQVASQATDTSNLTSEMAKLVEQGETAISNASAEMSLNAARVADSAQHVGVLSEQSQHVGSIVHVIRDIADQTNLLALNAAIEAARAGENGRGFAVVADEVRKLAERTSTATSEIGALIDSIQRDTATAVSAMEACSEQSARSASMAHEAGEMFDLIREKSTQAALQILDIASAAQEQNSAGETVAASVEQVARMSEENSAATHSVAQAAGHLTTQATALEQAVARFRI